MCQVPIFEIRNEVVSAVGWSRGKGGEGGLTGTNRKVNYIAVLKKLPYRGELRNYLKALSDSL